MRTQKIDLQAKEQQFETWDFGCDGELINAEQAARVIGISLRTIRYWESQGRTPERISGRGNNLLYRMKDIRALAKRHLQEQALITIGISKEDLDQYFSLPPSQLKSIFVQFGFHPSLWP